MSRRSCTHHCRTCDSHFTSLEAFETHRAGRAGTHRTCTFPELPEGAELIEQTGACYIARGPGRVGVTLYSLERPGKYALEGRQTAEGNGREAV